MLKKIFEWFLGVLPIFIPIFLIVLVYNGYYGIFLGFILCLVLMNLRNYLNKRIKNKNSLKIKDHSILNHYLMSKIVERRK